MKRFLLMGQLAVAIASSPAWADLRTGLRAMELSDYATARKEFAPLAEAGDATAQYNVAKLYLYGWGVKKNETEAARWFRKAAEQGDRKAQRQLAHLYEQGIGVEKNPAEAKKWRDMGSEKKVAPAQAHPPAPQQGVRVLPSNEARQGRKLSPEEVATLERRLKQADPLDVASRARLLGYYFHTALPEIGRQATIRARRRHIFWIIENQPGSEIAALGEARIDPSVGPLADREGYERAKALWIRQAESRKGEPGVLLNAAAFLQLHDKQLAENVLKKGEALNAMSGGWQERLGYLYGLGILGVDGLNPNGIPISVDRAEQDGEFARKALKEVEASSSAMLLGTTGAIVGQYGMMIKAMHLSERDFGELAEQLLLRAQSLEPGNQSWAQVLGEMYSLNGVAARTPAEKLRWAKKALLQMERDDIELVPDARWNMGRLGEIAKVAFNAEEYEKAEKYARQLLALAEPHPNDERYGQAWHDANMVIGRVALKRGDVEEAKRRLIKAGQTPGGGVLSSFGPNLGLAQDLLERGEKSVVIEYLQSCKKFWGYRSDLIAKWIQEIRAGVQPDFASNLNY